MVDCVEAESVKQCENGPRSGAGIKRVNIRGSQSEG